MFWYLLKLSAYVNNKYPWLKNVGIKSSWSFIFIHTRVLDIHPHHEVVRGLMFLVFLINFFWVGGTLVFIWKIRERPFNLKRGYGFFSKKIFWFPMLLKKIFWFWWRNFFLSDSECLSYNLMLISGKKFRA